ncbi:MAG: sensor histidine kinase, partial [Saprospiraceae bacterium]|nr:sensor histidine kinase [Saprospiraceae bacterium]
MQAYFNPVISCVIRQQTAGCSVRKADNAAGFLQNFALMKRRFLLHLAFWLAYWLIYAYTYSRYDGNLPKYLITEALEMPARMLAAYGAMWFFQYFGLRGKWQFWPAFTGAATAVFVGGLLNRLLKLGFIVPHYFPDSTIVFWDYRMMYDIFDCVVAASTALAARLYFQQQAFYKREAALQVEKLNAELLALKRQVQPHFLFNTINNLYGLARMKSEQTAPMALKLANLLRYVLYEAAKPQVRLEQELELLKDYIELEKLRFEPERLQVKFDTIMDEGHKLINPLLLLPIVENAFKHGANETRLEAWVRIQIKLEKGLLTMDVQNSKVPERAENPDGIGLQNLKRQLELLYPGKHTLEISNQPVTFAVHLQIDL